MSYKIEFIASVIISCKTIDQASNALHWTEELIYKKVIPERYINVFVDLFLDIIDKIDKLEEPR